MDQQWTLATGPPAGQPRVTATERRRQKEAEAARLRARGVRLRRDCIRTRLPGSQRRTPSSAARAIRHRAALDRRGPAARHAAARRVTPGTGRHRQRHEREPPGCDQCTASTAGRRRALLGLDAVAAPIITGDMFDREIERLTRELSALDAPPEPWEGEWTPPQDAPRGDRPSAEVVPLTDRRGDPLNG